jgi:hypothetical protein
MVTEASKAGIHITLQSSNPTTFGLFNTTGLGQIGD